jgi:hypothetical protein
VGEAAKTAYNVLPDIARFAKGVATFPFEAGKVVAQIPSAAKGLVEDAGGVLPAVNSFMQEVPKLPFTTMDYIVHGFHLVCLLSIIVLGAAYIIHDYKTFKPKDRF